MLEPQPRAVRVRELFARAVETPHDDIDTLLAAHGCTEASEIAEVKELLAADAAASRFLLWSTSSDCAPWRLLLDALDHAARLPKAERKSFISNACLGEPSRIADMEVVLSLHDALGLPLDSPILRTAVTLIDYTSVDSHRTVHHQGGPRLEGRVISHYRVEALLGAGGMGVVYAARDLALGRMVALKVLPEVFTSRIRERLLLEADASSRLQHPAIATYYESGDTGGTAFIAMELVPGDTLRRRLRAGPIAVNDALAWTACVLEALSHAHAAGILHRDIKPENIMITGPQSAKLLDFGLAKHLLLEDAATVATVHTAAAVAGTLGYMSPEQIRNDPQDRRSDVFQVGAVLYEMLTGRSAFPGSSTAERLVAVLARDPDPIDRADVAASLMAAVRRALARDPDRRYPSAAAFLSDLRAVTAGGWIAELPDAIAILDFDNLSENPTHAWIATGLADALSTDLRKITGLDVLPRERVSRRRAAIGDANSEPSAAAIGFRLGCRWVLAGGYQVVGEGLRVTMHLVETATEKTVATEKVDGRLSDLFQIQDRLTGITLAALNLDADQRPRPTGRPSLGAYESYIRGRRLFLRLEKGSMEQAKQFYEDAVRVEPDFALALCGLAGFHAMQYTFTTDLRTLHTAAAYAQRAIDADPMIADAWTWLAYSHHRLGRTDEAYDEYRRAIDLDPSLFFPYYFSGCIGPVIGKAEESVGLLQRAMELEPTLSYPVWALACLHMQMGHYDEALWAFGHTATVDRAAGESAHWPGYDGFHGECLRRVGRLDEARARCLAALEDVERTDHMFRDTNRVVCLVALGRTALDQGDTEAARAAYGQAIAHVYGRQRTLAGGCLVVQALAGLARANTDRAAYAEALDLYQRRERLDFSTYWICADETTLLDLSRAAGALGLVDDSRRLRQRAADSGSFEAQRDLR